MSLHTLLHKANNRLTKMRLNSIDVFCLHHVCEHFDPEYMYEIDWMSIDLFKQKIDAMQQMGVEFISLTEAYRKLSNESIRINKNVVLTFDDGYASLLEALPWLFDNKIPVTLFVNGKYTDGISFRKNNKEKYLNLKELLKLNNEFVEIGHHGWDHLRTDKMSGAEFEESLQKNIQLLQTHKRYVPFYAYPYGVHTNWSDKILIDNNIIPVYINGKNNYKYNLGINRKLLDNYDV